MMEVMTITLEGNHISFLMHITGKRVRRNTDMTRESPVVRELLREAEMQTAATYIGQIKDMVVQWVALRHIFEVCAWDLEFE